MHARSRGALCALVLLVTLAACGGSPGSAESTAPATDQTTGPTTPQATPTPSPTLTVGTGTATAEPGEDSVSVPFPDVAAAATQEQSPGAMLTVRDIRVGAHDGYDRVVFELGGTGSPGWRVEYVGEAIDDPSGLPVELAGGAALQVVLLGMGYPMDTGVTEWAGGSVTLAGSTSVRQVVFRGTFEGQTQAFVGVADAGTPFRVFALTDPVRVVVDVRH